MANQKSNLQCKRCLSFEKAKGGFWILVAHNKVEPWIGFLSYMDEMMEGDDCIAEECVRAKGCAF